MVRDKQAIGLRLRATRINRLCPAERGVGPVFLGPLQATASPDHDAARHEATDATTEADNAVCCRFSRRCLRAGARDLAVEWMPELHFSGAVLQIAVDVLRQLSEYTCSFKVARRLSISRTFHCGRSTWLRPTYGKL